MRLFSGTLANKNNPKLCILIEKILLAYVIGKAYTSMMKEICYNV